MNNIFTVPARQNIWKAITTPYAPGTARSELAGTVETRSFVANGAVTIAARVTNQKRRTCGSPDASTQAGAAVAGAQVSILINGKSRFRVRTNAAGAYTTNLKKTGRRSTSIFQARVTVAERDITATGCASPTPGVPAVRERHRLGVRRGERTDQSPALRAESHHF